MSDVLVAWAEEVEGSGDGGAPAASTAAGLLWCQLQRASCGGASGWGSCGSGAQLWHFWVGILRQRGSALAQKRRGLALVLLGGSPVAAGLGAGVEGRGSGGSGAQRWRQCGSCGIDVEGGNDGTEGGGGVEGGDRKLGSLTVQTKILLWVRILRRRVTPLIPDTLLVSTGIAQPIPKMRVLVSADIR
jgi:hypothetical protein